MQKVEAVERAATTAAEFAACADAYESYGLRTTTLLFRRKQSHEAMRRSARCQVKSELLELGNVYPECLAAIQDAVRTFSGDAAVVQKLQAANEAVARAREVPVARSIF